MTMTMQSVTTIANTISYYYCLQQTKITALLANSNGTECRCWLFQLPTGCKSIGFITSDASSNWNHTLFQAQSLFCLFLYHLQVCICTWFSWCCLCPPWLYPLCTFLKTLLQFGFSQLTSLLYQNSVSQMIRKVAF